MNVSDAKRLKELEAENACLKKLLAESMLEIEVVPHAIDWTQICSSCGHTFGMRLPGFKG